MFTSAEEVISTTAAIKNRAFLEAKDKTIIDLKQTIPVGRTGRLAFAFLKLFEEEAIEFTRTGIFEIDLDMVKLPRPYARYNIDNLGDWADIVLNKFDYYFDIQLKLYGMERI